MSTLLQRVLEEASLLSDSEQERIARLVLSALGADADESSLPILERERYRVAPWSFGLSEDLDPMRIKAIGYGEEL